jgi:hypothetical protein
MTRAAPSGSLPERLCASSSGYSDPLTAIPWDTLDSEAYWMPEAAVSLYGLPEWQALDADAKRRLSQVELIAFLELGLWLEALFMQRIAGRILQGGSPDPADAAYQLHELREEAGHSLMFWELIRRSGWGPVNTMADRPRLAAAFARLAPYESAAFWATIYIGESVPDRLNRWVRAADGIPEAVREVVGVHMREEARHIAYARHQVERKLTQGAPVRRAASRLLIRQVFRQFIRTCFYPTPRVYAAAGLPEPRRLARRARANPARARLVADCTGETARYLGERGMAVAPRGEVP